MTTLLQRPEFIRDNSLPELLRWNTHTTDNIDMLVTQASSPSYLAITRDAIGVSYATGVQTSVTFNRVSDGSNTAFGIPGVIGSQGDALSWSLQTPKTIFVNADGLYLVFAQFGWNISAGGNERGASIWNPIRFETYAQCNGLKGGYNINNMTWFGYLLKGDQLQLQVYQDSGGAILEASVPYLGALKLSL